MRVSEIQTALKKWKVDYADCFDKESLLQRYKDAAAAAVSQSNTGAGANVQPNTSASETMDMESTSDSATASADKVYSSPNTGSSGSSRSSSGSSAMDDDNDRDSLASLRQLSVKALRQELAERNLRWAGMLEKQDLVRAVFEARQVAHQFSVTGLVTPGQVADLNEAQLRLELQYPPPPPPSSRGGGSGTSTSSSVDVNTPRILAPLLVDVYATWCGPCQLLQGQLRDVATHMQDRVRIVKMDSDQNPNLARQWKVQGLPTLILFDRAGQEIDRIEGALMKDQLIQWMESKI